MPDSVKFTLRIWKQDFKMLCLEEVLSDKVFGCLLKKG